MGTLCPKTLNMEIVQESPAQQAFVTAPQAESLLCCTQRGSQGRGKTLSTRVHWNSTRTCSVGGNERRQGQATLTAVE